MFRVGLLIALVSLILDQLSKWQVMERMFGYDFWSPADRYPAAFGTEITSFFNLVAVWNRGVSFGLFSNESNIGLWILSLVALAITGFVVHLLRKEDRLYMVCTYGLIIGGALGNVIDRVRFGAVFDFLDFHAFGYHWPAFNVSDSLIFVGVGLWLFEGVFASKPMPG